MSMSGDFHGSGQRGGPSPVSRDHSTQHVPAIDGVRGIAILLVITYHSLALWPSEGVTDRLIHLATDWTWSGVDLFFVLSGFLITGILLDAKGDEHYFRTFYVRRALRIFPLYYITLLVVFALATLMSHTRSSATRLLLTNQPWYWAYGVNVLIARNGSSIVPWGLSHLWSLSVEEQFYLVWPTVVWFTSSAGVRRLAIAVLLLEPIVRLVAPHLGISPTGIYALTLTRLDPLAIGAFLATAIRRETDVQLLSNYKLVGAVGGAALVIQMLATRTSLSPSERATQLAGFSCIAVVFGAFLGAAILGPPGGALRRFLEKPLLRTFGRYSYAMYIVHYPFIHMVARVLPTSDTVRLGNVMLLPFLTTAVIVVASSLAIAKVTWTFIEQPFLKLKRFVPYAHRSDEHIALRRRRPWPAGASRN